MGNILLVSENNIIIEKFRSLLNVKVHNFYVSTSITEILKEIRPDICILDEEFSNNQIFIKNIKSGIENVKIVLYTKENNIV